jgi:hypothetical protein
MVLPQHAPYSEPLEVLICGGSVPFTEIALDNCVTIAPDVPNSNWTIERMPSKRLMPNIVALPDGTFLILNGARQGRAGFGLATDPNYGSVLYDPTKPIGSRMTVMATPPSHVYTTAKQFFSTTPACSSLVPTPRTNALGSRLKSTVPRSGRLRTSLMVVHAQRSASRTSTGATVSRFHSPSQRLAAAA